MKNTMRSHAAGLAWMVAGSLLTVNLGRQIPPWPPSPEAYLPPSAPVSEEEPKASPSEIEQEAVQEILPNVLNLAAVFPEGADSSDVLNSEMGEIYRELQILDQNWLDGIYNLSGMTPEQMADQLELSPDSIMGKYNKKDENHQLEDPSTWKVGSWKRIRVNVLNGDGSQASGDSNVKEILSMANVYTYFHDYLDSDLFAQYAKELWEASHSYEVSMSEVYYCDGCMDLTEEEEMAEDIADLQAEEISPFPQDLAGGNTETVQTSAREKQGPGTNLSGEAGRSLPEQTEETSAASSEEAVSEEEALSSEEAAFPSETCFEYASREEITEEDAMEAALLAEAPPEACEESLAPPASPSEIREPGEYIDWLTQTDGTKAQEEPAEIRLVSPGDPGTASPSFLSDDPESVSCPGHIDLTVTVHITGLSETNNLYALDSLGNTPDSLWEGWTEEMKAYAEDLNGQDWYENYGLTISNIALQMSMSPDEIEYYMDMLPSDLSRQRTAVIRFALESVGRVPYYWGGKPSTRGYLGNMFGSLIEPDYKGRIKKGLDCSGWISWVYWSATGERLPAEGTSGLISCGTGISRSQLESGDIIVRTGPNAHVVMFLGWSDNGKLLCIHETSGPANNVTISELDANWKYYRKLIE